MEQESAPDHPDRLIAALARAQHGVVGAAQLHAVGVGVGQVTYRLRVARLRPVHRGIYFVGHAALSHEAWWMAAVLAYGEGTVLGDARRRRTGARSDPPLATWT